VLIAGTGAPLVEPPPRMLDLEPAASMAGRRGIAPPCARRGRHLRAQAHVSRRPRRWPPRSCHRTTKGRQIPRPRRGPRSSLSMWPI